MESLKLSKKELLNLYNSELDELLEKSSKFVKNEVEFCSIVNARSGKCSQDCKYCAQSSHYRTHIETYPLLDKNEVEKAEKEAKTFGAHRFAVVTSGKNPAEEDFHKVLSLVDVLNSVEGMNSCASLGILDDEMAKKLSEHGLKRYHHNINTCRSYYPEICSTHTFDERVKTCKLVKKYGMELCCGVILGMGETVEQRIEMAMELAEIEPDSIPINILMPIPETPFEKYHDKIDEENILRTLAVFKIANPNAVLRFCGGRMRLSDENQRLALKTCVEGIMIGNYLTTIGKEPSEDIAMVKELGKKIKC